MFKPLRARLSSIGNTAVMLILLAFFTGAVIGSAVSHAQAGDINWWAWLDGFWQNFGTEMFGAFLTFLLIEVLVGDRKDKESLIRQLRSSDEGMARNAYREIKERGWFEDGTLRGADLYKANLQRTHLPDMNLRKANLRRARLQGAYLAGIDLEGADLQEANLLGARGLTIQQLRAVRSLEGTTLPDGTELPNSNDWQAPFEEWCKIAAVYPDDHEDENLRGTIFPASADDR